MPRSTKKGKGKLAKLSRKVNKLAALSQADIKLHDIESLGTACSLTGSVYLMSAIGQNDSAIGRIGNKAKLINYNFRYSLAHDPGVTESRVRVILFRDTRGVEDDIPLVPDILRTPANIHSFMTEATRDRFRVYYDKVHNLNTASNPSDGGNDSQRLGSMISWNGATGTDVEAGQMYMLVMGSDATYTPAIRYAFRLRFVG